MKKSILTLALMLGFSSFSFAQSSHLSLIYDFPGNDFDHYVRGMVGANDSLYVICNTPDGHGLFFRIDGNGEGYEVIWEFDDVNWAPSSLIGNDTVIYGTTRFSAEWGGTVFKYSLKDYSFEFIKDFNPNEIQEPEIKYVTDSVLWLTSQWSREDQGSVFTLNPDGTGLHKIYNDTDLERGQNPVDFVFHEGKIYIACFNGGVNPQTKFDGTIVGGTFIRINMDGTGYENVVPGGVNRGTQAQSLVIRENKLYGLFGYSIPSWTGQVFRSNLDGTEYEPLGALNDRALTRMLSTDSLIYGISSVNVFGIDPVKGEIRIFDDLTSNPDFGADVVSSPAYLNGHVYITAQVGGPGGGGTILRWLNEEPEINEAYARASGGRLQDTKAVIDMNKLFTDPEGDVLAFDLKYDHAAINVTESAGVISVTRLVDKNVDMEITARDGWTGHKTSTVTFKTDGTFTFTGDGTGGEIISSIEDPGSPLVLYPNPTSSLLKLNSLHVQSIDILDVNGKVCASFQNPGESVDISALRNGIYFVRIYTHHHFKVQKIIKN